MTSSAISLQRIDTHNKSDAVSVSYSSVFRVNGLNLYYGRYQALNNINLNIKKQGITGLIGPSGCGKTSFLYCLARLTGLVENCKLQGEVYFQNKNIHGTSFDSLQLRKYIGVVFQKPSPFPFSIYKNLELPLREHGVNNKTEIDDIIQTVLADVGLWEEVKDRLSRPATSLSGGQQQRLCIARAMALRPKVLLMDEPCSALDPISSGVVEELIQKLGENYTVVLVTHNLAQAKRTTDNVAFFWVEEGAGVLVETGATSDLFNNPQNALTAAYVSGLKG